MQELNVKTSQRNQLLDITAEVAAAVRADSRQEGIVTVFVPHTTAGVLINENADPAVCRDLLGKLARLVPETESFYTHAEGNSDAHLKASLVGHSVQVILEDGRLRLGVWQALYFAEFDGPRQRQVWVKIT